MAYNTVSIKKDVDGKPIPQYYNQLQNTYEVLQGRNGANRVELYDSDGNPVDLVGLIESIIDILNSRNLPVGASTEEKQNQILDKMNPKTHYLLSTDTKPASAEKGETVFEIDTQTVYMWNGNEWVVI